MRWNHHTASKFAIKWLVGTGLALSSGCDDPPAQAPAQPPVQPVAYSRPVVPAQPVAQPPVDYSLPWVSEFEALQVRFHGPSEHPSTYGRRSAECCSLKRLGQAGARRERQRCCRVVRARLPRLLQRRASSSSRRRRGVLYHGEDRRRG